MAEMLSPDKDLPAGISGKHDIIFGNLKEIYNFHNKWVVSYSYLGQQTSLRVFHTNRCYPFMCSTVMSSLRYVQLCIIIIIYKYVGTNVAYGCQTALRRPVLVYLLFEVWLHII